MGRLAEQKKKPKFQIVRNDYASPEERMESVLKAVEEINKIYGKGTIERGSEADPEFFFLKTIASGILSLDVGTKIPGFPRGRMTEIWGPNQVGKSSTVLASIAAEQARDPHFMATIIDTEWRFDLIRAYHFGVDLSRLFLHQTSNGEEAIDVARHMLLAGTDAVYFDSVTGLVPVKQVEGESEANYIALHARLMSNAARVLTPAMAAYDRSRRAAIVFVNQVREDPNTMFGNPQKPTGGRALEFYASLRLNLLSQAKDDWIYDESGEMIGQWVRYNVMKNSLGGPPRATGKYPLLFETGIDKRRDALNAATELGIVDKRGAGYYTFKRKDGSELKIQGEANFLRKLTEDEVLFQELYSACEEKIRERYSHEAALKKLGLTEAS